MIKSALYMSIERLINRNKIDGMQDKLDTLLSAEMLTKEEHADLTIKLENKVGEAKNK